MRKILLTIALAASSTILFGQGSIVFENIASVNGNYISADGFSAVLTPTSMQAPSGYYYTLLVAAYGGTVPSDNPLDPAWSQAVIANPGINNGQLLLGNNWITPGSLTGQMGISYTELSGTTGSSHEYIMLVGWSADMGTTWNAVYNELPYIDYGYFGISPVGDVLLGPTGGPGVSMYGGNGIGSGITLEPVFILEPGTMALGGLGGLCCLLFRRRK
jgi:hypothetical protein